MDDNIKTAFDNVKKDINFLNEEILNIKATFEDLNSILKNLINKLENQPKPQQNIQINPENHHKTTSTDTSTLRHINSTDNATSTHSSTLPQEIGGLKTPNLSISTGNQGASTDRQTDTSTDISTHNFSYKEENKENSSSVESNIKEATEILESLDSLKKEIRLKFKHLTSQEMLVFSTIYQLEEQDHQVTYKLLSSRLKLSESSVRDYIQRMINKGIPIKKEKINNKQLLIYISSDLKKIATLPTIIQLREL